VYLDSDVSGFLSGINNACFQIENDFTTIDCQDHWVNQTDVGNWRFAYSYADYTTIRNCNVENFETFFRTEHDGEQVGYIFDNNRIVNISEGINFGDTYLTRDIIIQNNYMQGTGGDQSIGVFMFGTQNAYIFNNTFTNIHATSLTIAAGEPGQPGYASSGNISIINNTMGDGNIGLLMSSNTTNVIISGNEIFNMAIFGLALGMEIEGLFNSSGTENFEVVNNNIYGSDIGIVLGNIFNVNVSNNNLNNTADIQTDPLSNTIYITDNIIVGGGVSESGTDVTLSGVMELVIQEDGVGLIGWLNPIETAGIVKGSTVYLLPEFVSVNSGVLDPSVDSSAEVWIGIANCSNFTLLYDTTFHTTLSGLLSSGTSQVVATQSNVGGDCTDTGICQTVTCSGGLLTFEAQTFSSFGIGTGGAITSPEGLESCQRTQTVLFSALGLIALMIIVGAGWFIVMIFLNPGQGSGMEIAIAGISVGATVFIGIFVIGAIGSLC